MTVDKEPFGDTLPTYLTRFVGRDREIATVLSLLLPGRLVTVCGVGGAGKTRLAIEVAKRSKARSHAMQAHWVPLGAVVDPTQVRAGVATGIGLPGQVGDRPLAAIVRALKDQRALLVLDNCEQVSSPCRELVGALLSSCPTVTVLATSRIPLGLPAEKVFAVPPMGGGSQLGSDPFQSDAIALFLDRATSVAGAYALTEHNAKTLSQICDVLHGLPLGIELAASWIPVLSTRDLLDHLRDATALASDSAPVEDRHRSLTVILDSSWQWLSPRERTVLSALAIFVGGFTREAAEAVTDADLGVLAALAERSLIQRLPDAQGGSRYQVHELVRHYALRQLEDDREIRRRHFTYFLELVETLETSWHDQLEPLWSSPIVADLANISAAMLWILDQRDAERALRMAVGLDRFWIFSVPPPAVRLAWLQAALDLPWSPTGVVSTRARARAYLLASLLKTRADPVAALELSKQGRMLFDRIGDEAGAANCLQHLGAAHLLTGDPEKGRREITEALVRSQALGDELAVGWAYGLLGIADFVLGRYNEASTHFLEAVSRFERLDGPVGACHALVDLGLTLRVEGKLSAALNAYRRALRYQREYRFTTDTGDTLDGLGALAVVLNGFELGAKLRGAAVGWRETYQQEPWFPMPTDFQELADKVRRHFGDQAWLEAYEAGRKLNPEGAMRLADDAVALLEEELQRRSVGLTAREIDVLQLVADGLSNAEIADRLVLSERTVHAHLRSIFDKLGVNSRTAAAHAVASLLASR